jgi:hypothetical protein
MPSTTAQWVETMRTLRFWGLLGTIAVAGALLIEVAPHPAVLPGLLHEIAGHPQATVDARGADAVAHTLVAALAWLALAWLVVAVLLVAAVRLPGRIGALAERATAAVVPAAVRRLLATTLGVTLFAGIHAGGALAAPGGSAPPPAIVSALNLDWPTVRAASQAGTLTTPAGKPPAQSPPGAHGPGDSRRPSTLGAGTPRFGAPQRGDESREVVVRRGDSLWSIAAQHLGPSATDEQIAREWPRWWSANRQVVGDDPDVIKPGQRLTPPAAER